MRKYGTAIIFAMTFIATFVVMCWHWQVHDTYAYCREKTNGMPWAVVAGDEPATPPNAEVLVAEAIPTGHWVSTGSHRISHYCPLGCCNPGNAWRTASGAPMVSGRTVAASRHEFAFGNRIMIDGHEYVVEDRGVGVGCIDILCDSHSEALRRGLFHREVFVWEEF